MEPLKLRRELDGGFVNERRKLQYPYIYLPEYGEEIALMMLCLTAGDIPIVLSDKGQLKQIGTVACSALELAKLLRVYAFVVHIDGATQKVIHDVTDIMEALGWMVS